MSELISTDPSNGKEVGRVVMTDVEAIAEMVAVARVAQVGWAALSFAERAVILNRAGALLVERAEAIGALGSQEMGKPLGECQGEAKYAAGLFATDLEEMREAYADVVTENERVRTTVVRDAHGVAVCIAPWNFPILMPHTQVLPALAAGNAVLFKPSERSPLTGQAYANALLEVLPDGVLQVVHGAGDQGKALVEADVDLVVFTGSRAAGVHILNQAGKDLKRVILELGGKDPMIVLDGANLDKAAVFAARNSFGNAGQVCVSTERIYVADAVHDAFVAKLIEAAKTTEIGPMVDARQKAHVVAQLDRADAQGAVVAWRGERNDGNYLAPVVLTGMGHHMEMAHDETFGPLACVFRVTSDAEAVRLANDTLYGLGAVVFGESVHARQVARQLKAGMIGVNQGLTSTGGTPWVGAGQSGYGFHSGVEGHRQFAQVRVLNERR